MKGTNTIDFTTIRSCTLSDWPGTSNSTSDWHNVLTSQAFPSSDGDRIRAEIITWPARPPKVFGAGITLLFLFSLLPYARGRFVSLRCVCACLGAQPSFYSVKRDNMYVPLLTQQAAPLGAAPLKFIRTIAWSRYVIEISGTVAQFRCLQQCNVTNPLFTGEWQAMET